MAELRSTGAGAAGVLLVAVLAAATVVGAQGLQGPEDPRKEGVDYEWWDSSWHMRVPILVRPQMPDAVLEGRRPVLDEVSDVPVHAEVDFTEVIRQVGDSPDTRWPQDVDQSLNSFTFDTDSVRVVEYDRESGGIVEQDETGDLVPSEFIPTLTERRTLTNGRFDASANAVGTVTWIAEDKLTSPRLYFVYFDIEENGDKPPQEFGPDEKGALDSLYWVRPGTDVYGYAPANSRFPPAVEVYGLHEDTAVRYNRYTQPGFPPKTIDSCDESDTGICVEGGNRLDDAEEPTFELQPITDDQNPSRLRVESQQDSEYFFHVEADKPVAVAVRRTTTVNSCPTQLFYPGDEGLVSESFTFTNLLNEGQGVTCDGLDLTAVAPQDPATVEWTFDGQNQGTFTVPAGGTQTIDLPDGADGVPVTFEASSPIAIVHPGGSGQVGVQAPTPFGAPAGSETLAPVQNHVRAVPWDHRAEVTTFDVDNPGEESARASEDGGPGAAEHVHFPRSTFEDYRGNVWSTSSDGQTMSVFHGDAGLVPLGGEEGRTFKVPVPERAGDNDEDDRMLLFPPYDRTEVTVTDNATGTTLLEDTLSQGEFLDRESTSDAPRFPGSGAYHVESSKPLLGYRISDNGGNYASYYSSVSRSPIYEAGDAFFHGHLVRWNEPLLTPTMAPGQEKTFTLEVTNLGREIGGGNLPDDIVITQEVSGGVAQNASGDLVTLSTQQVRGLDTFDSRDIKVVVDVPEEAETGDTLVVNLTAQSKGNPSFEAHTKLKIAIKTLFRVDLAFRDADCNPKSCERLVDSGASTLYAIEVNNTGTGDDEYMFQVSESQSGYDARIQTEDGTVLATQDESLESISVPRDQQEVVFLNVTAPDDAAVAFPYEAVVQAISQNDNIRDQVTATTVLSANTDFRFTIDDPTRPITPGETATFPIQAVNDGDDTVLEVVTSEPSLDGWNVSADPSSFLLRANGTTAPDGTRGDIRTVQVNVTASDDARVGQILPLEVTARSKTSSGSAAEESTQVRAVVGNNFTLATSGLEPRSLKPGEAFRYEFSVRNAANGPVTTTVNATGLPDGWRFEKDTPEGPTELTVGEAVDVGGDLVLPPGTPSGEYNVTFTFFSESDDGGRGVSNATGVIQVARRANLAVEPPSDLTPVPPGNRTLVPLNVTNAGNVDLTAELALDAPSDWGISFRNRSDARLPLEPGASTEVEVVLSAPAGIGDGPGDWTVEADLPLRSPQTFTFQADWVRRDLQVGNVEAVTDDFDPGAVSVLAATVRNEGNLPANNVDLAVVVDGDPVSNVTVETLPPGEDRVVQVEWTVSEVRDDIRLVVDPKDEFVETDETNNERAYTPTSRSALPAAGPVLAAAAVAAAAAARRRWSP